MTTRNTIYAIGDVHGRSDLLRRMFRTIQQDAIDHAAQSPTLVLLGDYVDRGPDSKGVLDLVCQGLPGFRTVPLLGNHEDMLLAFLQDGDADLQMGWFKNGAVATVTSYGVPCAGIGQLTIGGHQVRRALLDKMPAAHRHVLEHGAVLHETPYHVFVHAGIDAGLPMDRQNRKYLLWRRWGLDETVDLPGGRVLVHGHDVVGAVPLRVPGRMALDTGAYESGVLSCAAFTGRSVRILQVCGGLDG